MLAGIFLLVAGATAPAAAGSLRYTVTVSNSSALRAALNNSLVDEVFVVASIALDPADWSRDTPVLVTCDKLNNGTKYVSGVAGGYYNSRTKAINGFAALVALDFRGLVGIIRIGPGCLLELQYLEVLNHMQQDGTTDVYTGGMPAIDAAGSGPGAWLGWWKVNSYMPVGLPVPMIAKALNKNTPWVSFKEDSDAYCYMTTRVWTPVCASGVRHISCVRERELPMGRQGLARLLCRSSRAGMCATGAMYGGESAARRAAGVAG